MLSPFISDLSGPRGPYVTDGPIGHLGTLSPSTFMSEMTARQLLCLPVVAQTRPMEGCDPAVPRRLRRGRDDRTTDDAVAVDARQVPTASDTVVSRRIHNISECVTTLPKCSDCSRTDQLPLGSGHLVPAGHDTPA